MSNEEPPQNPVDSPRADDSATSGEFEVSVASGSESEEYVSPAKKLKRAAMAIWKDCCLNTDLGLLEEYLEFLKAAPLTWKEKLDMIADEAGPEDNSFEYFMWRMRRDCSMQVIVVESLSSVDRIVNLKHYIPRISREVWLRILPGDQDFQAAMQQYLAENNEDDDDDSDGAGVVESVDNAEQQRPTKFPRNDDLET